ncbi:MAG: endonuclease/exonuclease/phosphatase family protein [Patescibacteria group bacterium]
MWKHLDIVIPFLIREAPDVVCIQELLEDDISKFENALGGLAHFAPRQKFITPNGLQVIGIALLSRLPAVEIYQKYYVGGENHIVAYDTTSEKTRHETESCAVLFGTFEKDGTEFKIGTTHFTWCPDGMATDFQREDMRKLLDILQSFGELILTGDFNAPRGGEIFSMLADKYKDNIPEQYMTSIDGNLHRAGQLNLMVDGLFSTPEYEVSNVQMIRGVSDHCALLAIVSKKGIGKDV